MSREEEREVHPLVQEALDLAYTGAEPVAFEDWVITELKYSLKEYFGKPELVEAVAALINLASVLDDHDSPTAALKIIEVICTAADAMKEVSRKKFISGLKERTERKPTQKSQH
jgi:hypothetical protein